MTLPSSIVPLAIGAFLDVIAGAVASGVVVVDGEPRAGQSSDQTVVLTGWETVDRDPATFGLGAMGGSFTIEEDFVLVGYIRCYEGDEDQATSRTSAFALFSDIESAVRLDPTLGTGGANNTVRASWFHKHTGTQGAATPGGTGTQLDFELRCQGRIQ